MTGGSRSGRRRASWAGDRRAGRTQLDEARRFVTECDDTTFLILSTFVWSAVMQFASLNRHAQHLTKGAPFEFLMVYKLKRSPQC